MHVPSPQAEGREESCRVLHFQMANETYLQLAVYWCWFFLAFKMASNREKKQLIMGGGSPDHKIVIRGSELIHGRAYLVREMRRSDQKLLSVVPPCVWPWLAGAPVWKNTLSAQRQPYGVSGVSQQGVEWADCRTRGACLSWVSTAGCCLNWVVCGTLCPFLTHPPSLK